MASEKDIWALYGVNPETRLMFRAAASKRGEKMGELAEKILRQAAEAILQPKTTQAQQDSQINEAIESLSGCVSQVESHLGKTSRHRRSSRRGRSFSHS